MRVCGGRFLSRARVGVRAGEDPTNTVPGNKTAREQGFDRLFKLLHELKSVPTASVSTQKNTLAVKHGATAPDCHERSNTGGWPKRCRGSYRPSAPGPESRTRDTRYPTIQGFASTEGARTLALEPKRRKLRNSISLRERFRRPRLVMICALTGIR